MLFQWTDNKHLHHDEDDDDDDNQNTDGDHHDDPNNDLLFIEDDDVMVITIMNMTMIIIIIMMNDLNDHDNDDDDNCLIMMMMIKLVMNINTVMITLTSQLKSTPPYCICPYCICKILIQIYHGDSFIHSLIHYVQPSYLPDIPSWPDLYNILYNSGIKQGSFAILAMFLL